MIYSILALAVLLLSVVPIGTAAFILGFIYGEAPCVLCWEQRIGMAIVALVGLFVLRYGPKPKYVGAGVLVSGWGVFMGLRHMSLHAARDIGQGFAAEMFGAHTYTWSVFIFWVCVLTMAVLLMLVKDRDMPVGARTLRPLESVAGIVFLVVIAGNIVQAFAGTGPPPYVGQSDPVRFSFNPAHWVWSMDEWSAAPVSLRGRWDIDKPAVPATVDPAKGPLRDLPVISPREQRSIGFPVNGPITDLAYDAVTDRFLLTTPHGVYISDGTLGRLIRYTVVDPGFSVDLGRFAGGAFLDGQTVIAMGENKSYVVLRENDTADAARNFRFFLESADKFDELSRSRFGTIRARMMYVMSLAFDPDTDSIYTVSVPNNKVKRLVVSRFLRGDMTLSEEFTPGVREDAGLTFAGEKRSLDELYVTGAAISGGRMYALDAAFGTLLTIDLASHSVLSAQTIAGLDRPTGLAIKTADLYVVGESGRVVVIGK